MSLGDDKCALSLPLHTHMHQRWRRLILNNQNRRILQQKKWKLCPSLSDGEKERQVSNNRPLYRIRVERITNLGWMVLRLELC